MYRIKQSNVSRYLIVTNMKGIERRIKKLTAAGYSKLVLSYFLLKK